VQSVKCYYYIAMRLPDHEQELSEARANWDLDRMYRCLIAIGMHQLRCDILYVGSAKYRVSNPDDKQDVIHEAACSLIIQLKLNPSKVIKVWHVNMRYAIKDVLRARKRAESIDLEVRDGYGGVQSLYEAQEVL